MDFKGSLLREFDILLEEKPGICDQYSREQNLPEIANVIREIAKQNNYTITEEVLVVLVGEFAYSLCYYGEFYEAVFALQSEMVKSKMIEKKKYKRIKIRNEYDGGDGDYVWVRKEIQKKDLIKK